MSISLDLYLLGCATFVHVHGKDQSKLKPRALKCAFVGYSSTQKGYKCFHPPTRRTFFYHGCKNSLRVYLITLEQVFFFFFFLLGGGGGRLENLSYLSQNEPTITVLPGLLEFIQAKTDFGGQIKNENLG